MYIGVYIGVYIGMYIPGRRFPGFAVTGTTSGLFSLMRSNLLV